MLAGLLLSAVPLGIILLGGAACAAVADWLEARDRKRQREADERLRRMYRRRAAWDALERLGPYDPTA